MSEDTKKEAVTTKGTTSTPKDSVPRSGKKVKKQKSADGGRLLTMESSVRMMTIKCYEEQMPNGWSDVCGKIAAIDTKRYQVFAIKHDRDTLTDDIFLPSVEKPHYHIVIRSKTNPTKVRVILNLFGIKFRPGEDDALWTESVRTVKEGKFASAVMYLTHETAKAIEDGKEPYDRDEVVSNLTRAEVDQVREGYVRTSVNSKKVTIDDMADLTQVAYKHGYDLKDWDDLYYTLPLQVVSNTRMRFVREWYDKGVSERVAENPAVVRCCIFIKGKGNLGKSFNACLALKGKKVLAPAGGDSGMFDELKASHEAIVLDDDKVRYVLNMADNRMTQAYRRNRNNPWWCGYYFIITSNKTFEEWAEDCGVRKYISRNYTKVVSDNFVALEQRFFVCHVDEEKRLICDKPSMRGTPEDQETRLRLYEEFRNNFNEALQGYKPDLRKVDYSGINGEPVEPQTEDTAADPKSADRLPVTADGFIDVEQIKLGDIELPFT